MEIFFCDRCNSRLAPNEIAAGRTEDGKFLCSKCAPQRAPSGAAARVTNLRDSGPAQNITKFYFCETCGKRITDKQILDGLARDKKLKGVYCNSCAVGVMTMEMDAINIEQLAKARSPALPLPRGQNEHRRSPYKGSSVIRVQDAALRRPTSNAPAAEKPEKRRPLLVIIAAIGALLIVGGIAALALTGNQSKTGETVEIAAPVVHAEPAQKTLPSAESPPREPERPLAHSEPVKPAARPDLPAPAALVATPPRQSEVKPVAAAAPPKPAVANAVVTEKPKNPPVNNGGTPPAEDFEGALDPRWRLEGAATSDEQAHSGKRSLKLIGKQSAVLTFSAQLEVPVKIRMWIYDNGAKLDGSGNGGAWGVQLRNGDKFCVWTCWRKFLDGNKGYAWVNTGQAQWFAPGWACVMRKDGWNEWLFDFSDPASPKVSSGGVNVRNVSAKYMPQGAVAIFLAGGDTAAGPLYVDDISLEFPKK